MNSYRVFDHCRLGQEIALRDGDGRFHIARTLADVPTVGTDLAGVEPQQGLGVVLAATGGQMYDLIFEVVNCSLQTTFDRLHPARSWSSVQ